MANDLINMDAFKDGPAQAFTGLDPHAESLADGIGSSYGVIGYKGKVWTIRHRGQKHVFVRPDDGTPASYIDVVVLHKAKEKSKSFYEKYDPSGTSEGARPICSSVDGRVPDADVTTKQAETCALCPRNVWKTDVNGRKGRECQDYMRLAVLLMPIQTVKMFGDALMEPVFLRVPPASLNNMAQLGEQMAGIGYHFSTYVTRISFDPTEAHPKMVFRALQKLTNEEAPVVMPLRADPQALRIIGEDQERLALAAPVNQPVLAAPGTNPTGLAVPSTSATGTTAASTPTVLASASPASTDAAPPATQNTPQQTVLSPPASATAKAATGAFGGVIDVPTTTENGATAGSLLTKSTPQTLAPTQSVSDTGEPDEADAALDERIAQLMPKSA